MAYGSTIGGGYQNTNTGPFATIPGGYQNVAGQNSFAAGQRAKANDPGSFVWADSTAADFASTGNNQFLIRAGGGVGINTASPGFALTVQAPAGSDVISWRNSANELGRLGFGTDNNSGWMQLNSSGTKKVEIRANGITHFEGGNVGIGTSSPGALLQVLNATCNGTTWANASDRNLKENFAPVDARAVLEKVAAMPVQTWNYKVQPNENHLGPVAQDFYAAFHTGTDDKHITTVDEGGVALAAIQGLNQKLDETRAENAALKARLEKLERLVSDKNGGAK